MKKLLILLSFFALTTSAFSQSEKPIQHANFGADLDAPLTAKERGFIDEVYGDYANELVYNNPHRLKSFKNILRNRVLVNRYDDKNLASMTNLSEVPLANSINKSINRDAFFNADNFNPLKYNFGFFSRKGISTYRVDNTQYVITILPQH